MIVKFNKKDQKIPFSKIARDEKLDIHFAGGLVKLEEKAALKRILKNNKKDY